MFETTDIQLPDGRALRVYDTHPGARDRLAVLWHHGTPNVGQPPEPLFAAAERLGLRWISYDRPGYGGSSRRLGRDLASAAGDAAAAADALGVGRFAVFGHSGGSNHALACAAQLPDRVAGVVSVAALAPFGAAGLDWFAGMYPGGEAELRASVAGRAELERCLAEGKYDREMFTPDDHAALAGRWRWLATVAGLAMEGGLDGMVDDDLSYVAPWGFELADITAPVLLLHGGADRIVPAGHGRWLADQLRATCWTRAEDGHLSVLTEGDRALAWLAESAHG
ncbi:alpha/beta hydrolase [Streptomyces tateyamensis]|uniref:Alpha/beta hydrolase n=1 Tax=Streptomyces tateyamensis TaxID=565073 RepID=A0A2V4NHL0_9ACTN|nr:alpha/beta fold hydrolase [Streptomyces tateyamensis]PYC84684.1 alpha/beta hydrolase [Streptomyces tateyamensis]